MQIICRQSLYFYVKMDPKISRKFFNANIFLWSVYFILKFT